MIKGKMTNYLICMLICQIIFILVPHIPIGADSFARLDFIALTNCGLLGSTIVMLYNIRKGNKESD